MKRAKAAVLLVALLLFGTAAYAADVPIVTEPITIEIWHTRGAGANGDQIAEAVAEFNATNPHGITVVEVYQGGYVDTLAKTMQAIAAGTNPELVVLERAAGVPVLAGQGVLLEMMPFAQRDRFDLGKYPEVLLGYSFYDGQLISLPYSRTPSLFYYN